MLFRKEEDTIVVEFPELPGAEPIYFDCEPYYKGLQHSEVGEDEVQRVGHLGGVPAVDVQVPARCL